MTAHYPTLADCIGNTPLIRLQRLAGDSSNTLLVKLEGNNPAGSVKDRPALAMIERAGIELPEMYRLGFNNANCIGCCKGGMGYWNHVRKVHPLVFRARLERQESIGPGAYFFRDRDTETSQAISE